MRRQQQEMLCHAMLPYDAEFVTALHHAVGKAYCVHALMCQT